MALPSVLLLKEQGCLGICALIRKDSGMQKFAGLVLIAVGVLFMMAGVSGDNRFPAFIGMGMTGIGLIITWSAEKR